ncbi:MAG: hypothetical protein KJ556_06750 [Gammaproteobacteria bacterium]|nr:hypothetical protein [Gammaproteobacteria bacterium]MBU2059047.1 hypothetical protein [Gammaproteobacteria bacterium]MBU2174809.1 hypothetical protein [Gammaproteobacteria bacterium]MBU2245744.1 hypothetical protein [Gammaproteobacteria bacterium]MBU2343225.1 hypothetical protein [Gammaproteobacteria bacterium]
MDTKQLKITADFSELTINRSRRIPIEAIGLPTRAISLVKSCNAKNSYDAIAVVLDGFSGLAGIGVKTISESKAAIHQFLKKLEIATEEEIKMLIDPREEFLVAANGNLAEAFPAIVNLYLSKKKSKSRDRDSDVLNKRFGLNGNKKYKLEELGTYYDVTRERIRQIEDKSLKELSLLMKNKLNQKGWKICPELQAQYLVVEEKINDSEWIVLKEDVERIFRGGYGEVLTSEYLDLFMEVCGYIKMPSNIAGFRGEISESWCKASNYKKSEIESIFQALDVVYDTPKSIQLFDLIISAKKKMKSKANISNESIKIALSATGDINFNEDQITVKFSRLRSAADKALRVLESHGKPVHFSKITQEINVLGGNSSSSNQVKETNLKNQLVADNRFTPIGKSGEWGLTEWAHLNNITIIEAIEKVLHAAGRPLPFADIEMGVSKVRPDASPKSLIVYLNDQTLFTRVGKGEFALSAWRMKAAPKKDKSKVVLKSDFNQILKGVLLVQNPIKFPTLLSEIARITGLSEVSVRQKVLATEGLKLSRRPGERFKTVFCQDLEALVSLSEEKILLRDKVQVEIRAILFEQPNVPYKKGDLYKEVLKNVKCIRPTFYQYLDKMDDIHKFKKGNDYYAVYKHEECVEKIEIEVDKYTSDEKIKDILKRPLALLTLENVDLALFELGLTFENTLKNFLLQKKNEGILNVSSKDTLKLVNMVDCVVREGVVTKGHHLSTLREERNNRAHGNPPSILERRELFNKAHYISDLFVRYICFFQEKMR